ncbi:hypothetical protein PISMIDRAFT_14845 [Pisolithus microcarpus 441]|uniref:Uncharacterized protein n=1 Tax=Pisolithus microcarpus 441 TaxID=765257 RepID=A0A0C9XYZ8_9AGAM|nr:hypothetical protein PISMIDRAFT_14845 [Pisolithus microcarpus 441]
MCDDVPDFQRCDGYDAPLNTRPYALFDTSSDNPTPSPQLSSISSQVELSSFSSFDKVPLPRSFPGQSFSIRHTPVTRGRLDKGKKTERGPPLHQSVLFANGSRPGGVSAAFAHSTHGRELEGPSPSTTPEVPQIRVIPSCDPDHLFPPSHGDLVPASPDYFNYVWMLAIFDRGYPFDGKTEEQNDRIRVLSEVYRGTDIAMDRVPDLLSKTRLCPADALADSIDRLLADLIVNISAIQYKLVLELASIISADECQRVSSGEDTPATAGLTVGEKCSDVTIKIKEAEPDPWSQEPIEFTADDGYSKKRDASFSETARFLSETVPSAASSFHWRSFLDAAAWNKANHSLHNAVNTTEAIPPATFHPVIIDSMLRLYLAGRAPAPLAHPLYQYACYDCRHFGHWSCRNGRGSRWTPATNVPAKGENEGTRRSTTRPIRSSRHCSPTPGPSVNPGRSGVQ